MIGDEFAPYFKALGLDFDTCPYRGWPAFWTSAQMDEADRQVALKKAQDGLSEFPAQLVETEVYPWEVTEDGETQE